MQEYHLIHQLFFVSDDVTESDCNGANGFVCESCAGSVSVFGV